MPPARVAASVRRPAEWPDFVGQRGQIDAFFRGVGVFAHQRLATAALAALGYATCRAAPPAAPPLPVVRAAILPAGPYREYERWPGEAAYSCGAMVPTGSRLVKLGSRIPARQIFYPPSCDGMQARTLRLEATIWAGARAVARCGGCCTDGPNAISDPALTALDPEDNNLQPTPFHSRRAPGALRVIFFLLEKLGAVIGTTNLHIYAAMRGESLEEFQKTRNSRILYSVAADAGSR
jgi:hypothetical protein